MTIIKIRQLSLHTGEIYENHFRRFSLLGQQKSLNLSFLSFVGISSSAFCFNLLYAISADDTGQEMREIHKFKNMPWVLSLSLVVELLRLKTTLHTLNEPFDFGVQGIASLVGDDLLVWLVMI